MPTPTAAVAARGRSSFQAGFTSDEERAEFYRELSASGVAARRRRRQERNQAIADLRRALEILAPELVGGTR